MDKNNNILNKISEKVGITRNEMLIVLLLVFGLLTGVIYRYFFDYEKENGVATTEIIVQKLDSLDNADTTKSLTKIKNIPDSIQIENPTADIITNDAIKINSETKNKLLTQTYIGIININTANKTELMKLNRVGPKIADAIIEYRQGKPFRRIEEIMFVKGIGDKTFEKIKKNIKV